MEFGKCVVKSCDDVGQGRQQQQQRPKKKIGVTILTGYLGSGKTTVLNNILKSSDHKLRIAVIENEFGEVGVDDALLEIETEEEIFEMNNGCVCCTVRGDLIRILNRLLTDRRFAADDDESGGGRRYFDHVIIETTGLADPAPVAQTFFVGDDVVKSNYELDAIVTVVDARHVVQHLREIKPEGVENESVEQIAFADKIVLNKIDLLSDDGENCEDNGGGVAADRKKKEVIDEIRKINKAVDIYETTYGDVDSIPGGGLKNLLNVRAFDLGSVLEKEEGFLNVDDDHEHDSSIGSVGIVFDGPLNLRKLNTWLTILLRDHGVDIFRSKGVLNIEGSDARYVFQGVHMLMTITSSDDDETTATTGTTTTRVRPWKSNEPRTNRIVFIGRNLNRENLTAKFKECLA